MTENIDNIIIEHLKALRNDLKDFPNKHDGDISDLKQRLTVVERGVSSIKHEMANSYESQISQQVNIDRLSERLDKIEKRLELS